MQRDSAAPATTHVAWTLAILTACAMLAFAANSLLARLALRTTPIDAASFTRSSIAALAGQSPPPATESSRV